MSDTGQSGLQASPPNPSQDGRFLSGPGGSAAPQPDQFGPGPSSPNLPRSPYGQGRRLFYGMLWTGWTILLGLGGLFALPHGRTFLGGMVSLGLAVIAGRYAYRIWTWQAKRLVFFIIW